MKKIILAAAIVGLSVAGAFAQTSQPQGGANQSPTSPTSDTKDGMKKDSVGTSGMSSDSMKKDGMMKDMKADSKDNKPVDGGMKK